MSTDAESQILSQTLHRLPVALGQPCGLVYTGEASALSCNVLDVDSGSSVTDASQGQRSVHILALDKKGKASGIPQELRHPREIDWLGWRRGVSSS